MCMSRLRLRVVSANRRPSLATARRECGLLWQPRFFGRALRTLQGYISAVFGSVIQKNQGPEKLTVTPEHFIDS